MSIHLTRPPKTSLDYLICLFISSVNHSVCVRHAPTNSYYLWSYLSIIFTLKMLDISSSSGIPQQDIDKFIIKALKVSEEFGFKDISLWEIFQDNFKDFMKENFKSASTHHLCKLRDYLQKFGVCIQKQERYNIARALYKALLKEEPTD